MSFSCYNHGWSHLYQPCPACGRVGQSADTVGTFKYYDNRDEIIAQLQSRLAEVTKERDELRRKLEAK